MRKLKALVLVSSLMLVASGCSLFGKEETITCTKSEENSGMILETKIVAKLKGGKLVNEELIVDVSGNSYTDDVLKIMQSNMEKEYNKYKADGVDVKVETKDKVVTTRINVDYEKADDSSIRNVTGTDYKKSDNKNISVKRYKEEPEKKGYTCK